MASVTFKPMRQMKPIKRKRETQSNVNQILYLRIMGTGASTCPADKMMQQKRRQAMKKRYTQSEPSDFYCACRNGDVDYVREHLPQISIEDVDRLEAIGDTALHVATRNDHKEIVKLLLKADCSKITLNHEGKMPHEEIKTPEMKKVYMRPTSTYFHEPDSKTTFDVFQRINREKVQPIDQEQHSKLQRITEEQVQEQKRDWIQTFKDNDELKQYSLNNKTAAMWWKVFHWASHAFIGSSDGNDYRSDAFDLESDRDFDEFLKKHIENDVAYQRTKEALREADTTKSIVPLIILYTSEYSDGEHKAFYKLLNEQLALASKSDIDTSNFCTRFVYEFDMKSDQLEKRAYTGQTFRGALMSESDIEQYKELTTKGENGVIALRAFTSTSRIRDVAMHFLKPQVGKKRVLYVFNIPNRSNGIVSVQDISRFPDEEEVLIIPGNLFTISSVRKDEDFDLTEIHLEHINTKVTTFKKLIHTIRAMRQRPKMLEN
ncbi:unnamed protein product [Adineta steineri]|uniref:ADP ribosyltransferase domain-containing protein n=1 Tax=Adineta steineri TaxID=433720 RepID=A0A814LA46_9BILA|nr:unnamed protein product [Adineta steineri]CAF4128189.1 unnamed protein product [Adineta steineri]